MIILYSTQKRFIRSCIRKRYTRSEVSPEVTPERTPLTFSVVRLFMALVLMITFAAFLVALAIHFHPDIFQVRETFTFKSTNEVPVELPSKWNIPEGAKVSASETVSLKISKSLEDSTYIDPFKLPPQE